MDKDLLQKYFFIGLLLCVSIVVILIFLPFAQTIALSTVFAVVLAPLYNRLLKWLKGRKALSALIIIMLFLAVIIIPVLFLASQVLGESKNLYQQLSGHSGTEYTQKITAFIEKPMQKIYPDFSIDIAALAGSGADWLTGHLTGIFSSIVSIFTKTILIFISLFFFLKDGENFKKILIELSPLSDTYDEQIFDKIKKTINGTVRGVILVAIVQGFLAGLGLWLFHVPNPTLWGCISAVGSLVPGLGTFGVFIPAILYMYATGDSQMAFGLTVWGGLIIAILDNFISPYIYSKGVKIHQLLMLFSVLGSIIFFGPAGFIFGPIILGLFFALLEVYQSIILKKSSL